ncbi:MAG: flavodoxin [Peptoniphilus sp.]|nr:flavodoxin [Peptoniphilus sp.]MDY3118923.1 flavodoxin [Peptoniphilus sp.]
MVPIIYWSGTGNTEAMAKAIAKGLEAAGQEASLIEAAVATEDMVKDAEKIAFGCPAMGAEELEETTMRPFMDDVNPLLKGKKVLLFGSYDWADGEWMETWEEEVQGLSPAYLSTVICKGEPDEDGLKECEERARALSEA